MWRRNRRMGEKVGKIESDKYIFDVHQVEHDKYGKYDFKLKGKTLNESKIYWEKFWSRRIY